MVGRWVLVFGLLAAACTNVQTASDSGTGRDTGSETTTPVDTPGVDVVDVPDVPTIADAPDADVPDATSVGMDVPDADAADVADADVATDRENVSDVTDVPDVPVDAGPPRMTFTFVSAALVGGSDGGPQMRATISWHGMLRGESGPVRLEAFFR